MMLVTGATGDVGLALVDCLRTRQIAFRVAAHGPNSLSVGGVESVTLDFLDPNTFRATVSGEGQYNSAALPAVPFRTDKP